MAHKCPKSFYYILFQVLFTVFCPGQLDLNFVLKMKKHQQQNSLFSAFSGLYLLYETFVNKFLDFTLVLMYFVFAFSFFFFFLERRYRPERNLDLADFLVVVTPPIACSEVSLCPRFLLPP